MYEIPHAGRPEVFRYRLSRKRVAQPTDLDQQLYLYQVEQAAHSLRATLGSRLPDMHLEAAQLLVEAAVYSVRESLACLPARNASTR